MENYFSKLSIIDLLHIMRGCRERYENGTSCDTCWYFEQGHCDGKRAEDAETFYNDLLMEQMEQM